MPTNNEVDPHEQVEILHITAPDQDDSIKIAVQSTHSSHGHEVPVTPILQVTKDVLSRANESMDRFISGESMSALTSVGKTRWDGYAGILKEYASTINKISSELSCKCEADPHSTTLAIFNNLSDYFWDAKVVISLAAFAIIYGDFCLITQLSITNPLAMSVSLLKQPDIAVHANSLLSIQSLLEVILNVTENICKFQDILQTSNVEVASRDDDFSLAAYWTIRSLVACSSLINNLLVTSGKYITSTTEAVDVSSLDHTLTDKQNHLKSQIDQEIHYQNFSRKLKMPNADTMTIITPSICTKNDEESPLLDGSDGKRVGIKEGKTIILLISGLDIVEEELFKLKRCHNERKTGSEELHYEIVWIPVVDDMPSDEASRGKFKTKMQELGMPWYIVADPWLVDPVLIRYMKEVWNFSKKVILVVLDPQGKVVCKNALNMIRIWGNHAYPFTNAMEESLWKKETWRPKLLVNSVDQSIEDLISNDKFICLYGGSDTEWIRTFVTEAQKVAQTADVTLEMFYAGKSKAEAEAEEGGVKTITADIKAGKIGGRILAHQTYFWARLESMLVSRAQHIDSWTAKDDRILREVLVMLSFGESDKGWAVICKGSTDMVSAHGDVIMKILKDVSAEKIKEKGLVPALSESIDTYRKEDHSHIHCNRITIPWAYASIAEKWLCADCGRPMDMYLMYRCCND